MFGNGTRFMDPAGAECMANAAARRLKEGGGLCFIRIPPTAINEVSHA